MSTTAADTIADRLGLYVHFPWCVRKCPYCDFNSHPVRDELREDDYVEALLLDLGDAFRLAEGTLVDTVFFGGGTPSLFSPSAFARLLDAVRDRLEDGAEVTMEANPGTTEHHDMGGYRKAGVNRLSLGAQSFSDAQLARLGRIHRAGDTRLCFERARAAGFDNINLDIMYGLPGQSADQALADLEAALTLAPEHISWYQLTVEPRTEFARHPPTLPVESTIDAVEREGRKRLAANGYAQYEVSAYAQAGRRCRHNVNYWTFGDYLGAGAGAHGKHRRGTEVWRTEKPRQPRLYLADPRHSQQRRVPSRELTFEFMMNALRLTDGVDPALFQQRTGLSWDAVSPWWQTLADDGLVHPTRIAATGLGYRYLDSVLQRFLA